MQVIKLNRATALVLADRLFTWLEDNESASAIVLQSGDPSGMPSGWDFVELTGEMGTETISGEGEG